MKKTILIFGINSFIGSNLSHSLRKKYRIVGTYFSHEVHISGITTIKCDVLKRDEISRVISVFKPDYVLYAVGLHSLQECLIHPKKADQLNSAGAINCCTISERHGCKFIYISSAFVFGGDQECYTEADTPFPLTIYGNFVSSTEFYIQRSSLNYLILRCSYLFGSSLNPMKSHWFEQLQLALEQKKTIEVDDSVELGFLHMNWVGEVLLKLLDEGTTNRLFHLSSVDYMTKFKFATLYAKTHHKDESLIIPVAVEFPVEKFKMKTQTNSLGFRLACMNIEDIINQPIPTCERQLLSYKD